MRILEELKIWMGDPDCPFDNDGLNPIKISEKDYKTLCKLIKEYKAQEGEEYDIDWEFFNEFLLERNEVLYNKILDKVKEEVADMFNMHYENIDDYELGKDYGFYIDGEITEE